MKTLQSKSSLTADFARLHSLQKIHLSSRVSKPSFVDEKFLTPSQVLAPEGFDLRIFGVQSVEKLVLRETKNTSHTSLTVSSRMMLAPQGFS